MSEKRLAILLKCFVNYDGRGWEPKDTNAPTILWAIEEGYLKRADGRCMFEAFKDSHVTWTLAGRQAMESRAAKEAQPNV